MGKFDRYAFSKDPAYDEAATRKAFAKAVPLKTLVIYCYDPRAVEIPDAVAKALGNETYPGYIVVDGSGNRIASTATIFPIVVAGGRAVDALRSITVAQHLFGIQNIVVVHHSHCGATSFTADGIIDAYRHEHHADIADLYERGSICLASRTLWWFTTPIAVRPALPPTASSMPTGTSTMPTSPISMNAAASASRTTRLR
jgi:carbonic anhydrase